MFVSVFQKKISTAIERPDKITERTSVSCEHDEVLPGPTENNTSSRLLLVYTLLNFVMV